MKRRKKIFIAIAAVFGVAFISGASILAATTLGTSDAPLVTLSYLMQKFKPQVMSEVDTQLEAAEASASAKLDSEIAQVSADIDAKLDDASVTPVGFTLVTLSKDQTVVCTVGTELLLRIGTATASGGTSPALVDSTDGTTLSAGDALAVNHMYMVSIQGNGFKATAATVKVLIKGEYTII
jgi:hypothetical protein